MFNCLSSQYLRRIETSQVHQSNMVSSATHSAQVLHRKSSGVHKSACVFEGKTSRSWRENVCKFQNMDSVLAKIPRSLSERKDGVVIQI